MSCGVQREVILPGRASCWQCRRPAWRACSGSRELPPQVLTSPPRFSSQNYRRSPRAWTLIITRVTSCASESPHEHIYTQPLSTTLTSPTGGGKGGGGHREKYSYQNISNIFKLIHFKWEYGKYVVNCAEQLTFTNFVFEKCNIEEKSGNFFKSRFPLCKFNLTQRGKGQVMIQNESILLNPRCYKYFLSRQKGCTHSLLAQVSNPSDM